MRVLGSVAPTPEQLKIISKTTAGIEIIRGAAGSGKTTTAILRLRGLAGLFLNRRKSSHSKQPVRTLVLTFILDAAQRIYARGFSWSDVGIKLTPNNSHRLEVNYRNTKQIAAFAAPLIEGIAANDSLPPWSSRSRPCAVTTLINALVTCGTISNGMCQ